MRPVVSRLAAYTSAPSPVSGGHGGQPDFTLPLRMQSRGRSPAQERMARLRGRLMARALGRKRNWRLAFALGIPAGALESMLLPTVGAVLAAVAVGVAITLLAAVCGEVSTQMTMFSPESN